MNYRILASLLIASSTAFAAPVFASGFGPAPFYRPLVGAPSSQQGPSAQTIAAEEASHVIDMRAFGSSRETQQQSGSRADAAGSPQTPAPAVRN